jgi:hypothetical protein
MYITAINAITPQLTYDDSFANGLITAHSGNKYLAQEPDYLGLIAPNLLRRMGKSIRMGIGAGFPLISDGKKIDAIIIGSAEGGLEDCFKFLNQVVVYDEGTLSPTNFVQSTPNALAGNLALMTRNIGYNNTHVHKGNAFENALIDAQMLMEEGKAYSVLVGNVEEISDYNFNVETLAGQFKKEETTSENLLNSNTPGTICGEGSCMFVVQDKADEYLARIVDVAQIAFPAIEDIKDLISGLLHKNQLSAGDIDALVLGYNGDNQTDHWYTDVCTLLFPDQTIYTYKDVLGDCPSSIAFGTYLATQLLTGNTEALKPLRSSGRPIGKILVYNHYKGHQHGVILLSR